MTDDELAGTLARHGPMMRQISTLPNSLPSFYVELNHAIVAFLSSMAPGAIEPARDQGMRNGFHAAYP
jgi:hypothetical protein